MNAKTNGVCIILARGGSKGIPGKNLHPVGGKPLLYWSIERAMRSKQLAGRVYVSSDSDEILNYASKQGSRIIRRPDEFASDTATSESALLHAIEFIARTEGEPGYVVFLQPTSPIRPADSIDEAIDVFFRKEADSLFSAQPLKDHFLWATDSTGQLASAINHDYRKRRRRQELETTYLENGSLYIFNTALFKECQNRLGKRIAVFEMDSLNSFQIDNPEDIVLCDLLLRRLYPII